ncbi:unnamed protein product, partial [Medioppia subpectinata]
MYTRILYKYSTYLAEMLDLNGKQLTLPPFVFPSNGVIDGTETPLLHTLSHYMNFTYDLIDCRFDFGIKYPNNTWSGLIGKLVSQEADFGIFNMFMLDERAEAVPFSYPYFIDSVTFTYPAPTIRPNHVTLWEPFDRFT